MNVQAEKLDVIQWLNKVNDSDVIRKFVLLKRSNEERISLNLDEEEKKAVDIGLKSIGEGRVKSNQEVTEATRQKYPHLFK